MRRLLVNLVFNQGHAIRPTQREDGIIRKTNSPYKEGKTPKGESHERWDMKKDPKVFDQARRQDGNQTVKAQPVRGQAILECQTLSSTKTL
jgi:hypothetical protein